ncbi:MAG: histidine phosphatase family protein [Acidobacteria bacterium]|nr:histidine phosphatase family protein [Acidobacteriota bacterium]
MTTILLIRHGIAQDPRPGLPDAERALTEEGWKKTRSAMHGLLRAGYTPRKAYSSGFRRAAETLGCLTEATLAAGLPAFPCGVWEGLSPGGDPVEVEHWILARLQDLEPPGVLALVSHQPLLGELVFWLTGKNLEVKKASCTVVERRAGRWSLLRHFSPAELRKKS